MTTTYQLLAGRDGVVGTYGELADAQAAFEATDAGTSLVAETAIGHLILASK
jgi:hypothetical protein